MFFSFPKSKWSVKSYEKAGTAQSTLDLPGKSQDRTMSINKSKPESYPEQALAGFQR